MKILQQSVPTPESAQGIPAVNHTFEFDPRTASLMFEEGTPLTDSGRGVTPFAIMHSNDGQWIIRREDPNGLLTVKQTVRTAEKEIQTLQGLGIDVISRATTTYDNKTFVISPYLAGLSICPETVYDEHVAPKIAEYFKQAIGNIALYEVGRSQQYSTTASINDGRPFLHDIDPLLDIITSEIADFHNPNKIRT